MEDVVTAPHTMSNAHQVPTMVVSTVSPATTTTAATTATTATSTNTMLPPPTATPPPAKKSSTTLSVDRAAFLLLRVKKAFKRKRQHRKDKQAQALNASLSNQQGRPTRGKVPPPLLRSRTLPAIIVPGIPVVSLHTDKSQFQWDERFSTSRASTCSGNRWSLLSRNSTASTTPTAAATTTAWSNNNNNNFSNNNNNSSNFNNNNNTLSIKSLNLPQDDGSLVYRRKSSGSTPHGSGGSISASAIAGTRGGSGGGTGSDGSGSSLQTPDATSTTHYAPSGSTDDFDCYAADGSVLLRIPAPHVVAARAYRLASKKRTTSIFGSGASSSTAANEAGGNTRCSGNNTPTVESGCQIPGFSGCGNVGFSDQYTNAASNSSSGFSAGATGGSVYNSSSSSTSNIAITRRLVKLLHQSGTSSTSKLQLQQQQQQQQQQQYAFQQQQYYESGTLAAFEDAPRRLSWERRKDSSALQRSASIDSFAEIVWSDSPRPSLDIPRPMVAPFSKRPSASSLLSNCSTSSQSGAQLNINELCVSASGGASGSGGGGAVGGTMVGSIVSSSNNRRESLLSPSSTRRNKQTRIINGK